MPNLFRTLFCTRTSLKGPRKRKHVQSNTCKFFQSIKLIDSIKITTSSGLLVKKYFYTHDNHVKGAVVGSRHTVAGPECEQKLNPIRRDLCTSTNQVSIMETLLAEGIFLNDANDLVEKNILWGEQ